MLLSRYLLEKDGSTAHERMKGKMSKMLGFEFAESVRFRRVAPPGKLAKLEGLLADRHRRGSTDRNRRIQFMVASQDGVYKTRNIRWKPLEERWDKDAVEGLKFTPWRVREQAVRGPVQEHKKPGTSGTYRWTSADVPPPHRAEAIPMQVRITRAVLEKYGFTDGCLGCTNSAMGSTGIAHSDNFRKRIESKMKQADVDKARLQEPKRKRQEFVSRHLR